MDEKWQRILLSLEVLAENVGVELPPFLRPPAKGPVGPEWADPWRKESMWLDWLETTVITFNETFQDEQPGKS